MQQILKRLARAWMQHIHPRLMSFVATVGLLWLGTCLLILFGLANLADEVLEQEAFFFDESVLLWINQFATPTLDQVMLTFTRLGDPSTVVPLTCIGFIGLWLRPHRSVAIAFAINCIGGAVLSTGLKLLFGKARPALWPQIITETTYSFPSGHALGSMVLYGFSAYLLAQRFPKQKLIVYAGAIFLIGGIGLSRLYLGVHWPTDVLAGYGIGFLWISGCIALLRFKLSTPPWLN
ncbi:phosphatase PAP2 family protein [Leptolyngbya subtilissima ST-M1]|uniref:phosphatase PAP2 family protein n=1 Tax=Cyanophyceae TaxID=3028117 RepID=UPI001F556061|nr:phosphatase PAP2 family protein [Nodosilinea sp. FACHB-131]